MKKRPAPQRHRPLFYSLFFLYPHHIRGDLGQRMRTAHLHGVSQLTGQLINVALHTFLAAAIHSRDERAADQHAVCTQCQCFEHIHTGADADKDKCTGCGACANICPKQVIMIDVGGPRKPVVMCSNKDKGPVAMKACTTSCIACGMCERTCKFDAIHVVDGVARIDYDKCKGCGMCAQKCPKHIILFPLKDDPNPPKPVVKPAAPAAAPAAKPEAKAEAKPETKAE